MTTKFTIISGVPNESELEILKEVVKQHKRVEKTPTIKRSNWAQPIMRAAMPQSIKFGAGRNF